MRYVFLLIVTLVLLLCGASPSVGRAQPQLTDWPYRFIISGPATAHPGADVTYIVSYERVFEPDTPISAGFVFEWPPEAASLVSSRVVSGPQGTMRDQIPGRSLRWDFSGPASEGAREFVLHVDPGFTGDIRVFIYVPGTSIRLPQDSVTEVTTVVTAAGGLPTTGAGSDLDEPGGPPLVAWLGAALALAGAVLLAGAVAYQGRSSR